MARPKRDNSTVETEMQARAIEFSKFRQDFNLSQKLLGEVIAVSRRTIQSIEAGKIIPQKATLDKFEQLKQKYAAEGKASGRKKGKAA